MKEVDKLIILQRLVNVRISTNSDEVQSVTAVRIAHGNGDYKANRRRLTEAVKCGLIQASRKAGRGNVMYYSATHTGEVMIRLHKIKPQFSNQEKHELLDTIRALFPQSPLLNAICDDYAE